MLRVSEPDRKNVRAAPISNHKYSTCLIFTIRNPDRWGEPRGQTHARSGDYHVKRNNIQSESEMMEDGSSHGAAQSEIDVDSRDLYIVFEEVQQYVQTISSSKNLNAFKAINLIFLIYFVKAFILYYLFTVAYVYKWCFACNVMLILSVFVSLVPWH